MQCPTCKQALAKESNAFAPFCSERCKMIDLGHWLDGSYSLAGEPAGADDLARAAREEDE